MDSSLLPSCQRTPRSVRTSSLARAAGVEDPLEITPSPSSEPDLHVPADCPRCGGRLIDPQGLGWCKGCGFCRSLEEERGKLPLTEGPAPAQLSTLGLVEFGQLLKQVPDWAWMVLGGVGFVLLFTLPPALHLRENTWPRCLWATFQLVVGVVMLLAGQIWALVLLAPEDDRLSYKDAVFAGRLWAMVVRRLPQMRRQLVLGAVGLATIVSAAVLVGSLDMWFGYLSQNPHNQPPAAVSTQ